MSIGDREAMATDLYLRGRDAFKAGKLGAAVDYLRASAMLYPHFKTLELLGEALTKSGQHAEAAVFLAASAGLAPAQSRARLLLAQTLSVLGDNHLARIQATEAIRINPDHRAAHKLLEQLPADTYVKPIAPNDD